MLKSLSIRNFALIDNVELSFDNGLTVITGETGSGKSILLGALNLLLGSRADFSVIRDEHEKTIVEGLWNIANYGLESFFEENELDYEHDCIIRREVLPQGKSRAFINDTPVSLSVLKELTDRLIQINSQHQTLQLKDKAFQLQLLDTLGGCTAELESYAACFQRFKQEESLVSQLELQLSELIKQQDYISFQIDELLKLGLDQHNYDELILELKKAENAEFLLRNFQESIHLLDGDQGILSDLKKLQQLVRKSAEYDSEIQDWLTRIESQIIELSDLSVEINNHAEQVSVNPNRLEWLIQTLDDYQRILKKHHKQNQVELSAFLEELTIQTQTFETIETELAKSKSTLLATKKELHHQATQLSEKRRKTAPIIVSELIPLLDELKLSDARVEFVFHDKSEPDKNGLETVDLCFSPNKGVQLQSIDKSASGGELSRFMLVVMTLYSHKKQLPSIIFDEIDTGVSGDVAGRIGSMLRKMGTSRQLIAITHLPQVAASGHQHLTVQKSDVNSRTVTEVLYLSSEERKVEIAKLMSSKELTSAAIENANLLLASHGN